MLLFYGAVWKHLFDYVNPGLTHEQVRHLVLVSRTSVLRLFLSLVTTTMWSSAFFVALLMEPLRFRDKRGTSKALFFVVGGLAGAIFVGLFRKLSEPSLARYLFLYSHPGPPPPWIFAAVPIALAAALLFLAEIFMEHLEI